MPSSIRKSGLGRQIHTLSYQLLAQCNALAAAVVGPAGTLGAVACWGAAEVQDLFAAHTVVAAPAAAAQASFAAGAAGNGPEASFAAAAQASFADADLGFVAGSAAVCLDADAEKATEEAIDVPDGMDVHVAAGVAAGQHQACALMADKLHSTILYVTAANLIHTVRF